MPVTVNWVPVSSWWPVNLGTSKLRDFSFPMTVWLSQTQKERDPQSPSFVNMALTNIFFRTDLSCFIHLSKDRKRASLQKIKFSICKKYKGILYKVVLWLELIQGVRCCEVITHTYMWVFCKWNASHPLLTPYMIFLLIFYQLLPVVTCVGAWVVTEWSVSCLGNSHVITCSSW